MFPATCPLFRLSHCLGLLAAAWLGMAAHLAAQGPEETEDIRGPKPLVEIPAPEKPSHALWIGLGAGIAGTLLTWFIWNHLAARKKSASPMEVALSSLRELERDRSGLEAEAFANRTAQTVREYISARFGLAAPRRTTEEFLRDLSGNPASPLKSQGDPLRVFLKSCDLAKFSGARLSDSQRDELLDAARGFITAPAPVSPPSSAT